MEPKCPLGVNASRFFLSAVGWFFLFNSDLV
jgi:hypothetical protein